MNQSTAFRRKIIYLVILVSTLVPLYLLGHPSDGTADSGGQLAMMRHEFGIAESDLGEISPASETMKLATLGLRGVAATLLWEKAHEYRVKHEWDRLKASLNNIALLQPHYDRIWEHQAHNLAYNVSVEFDDYRQRYEMIREGTEFLTRGVRQNRKAPRLIWYTGWFYGQKIGKSDEKRQFRRLFADDKVLHDSLNAQGIDVYGREALGPLQKPDNWLVGRLWLNHGYDIVDAGVKIRRQTPINFFETGPKWGIYHSEAIEKEGILDERAMSAWTKAHEGWVKLGERSIETTSPFSVKLGGLDVLMEQKALKLSALQELAGKVYEDLKNERVATLPIDVRKVYEKKPEDRTEAGKKAIPAIEASLQPSPTEIAQRLPLAKQLAASQIISDLEDLNARIQKTTGYRTQINYVYWESLALAEQEDRTVNARKLIFEAEKANAEAEIDLAIKLYEEAFEIWAKIFDDYPILTIDDSADDLFNSIRRYMIAIDSEEMPDDFPLNAFAEMMRNEGINSAAAYELVREQQTKLAERRRKELDEQERQRAAEAEAAEKKEAEAEAKKEAKPEEKKDMEETPDAAQSNEAKSDKEAKEPAKAETVEPNTSGDEEPKA